VRPVTVRTHITAPREEIFDFVADLANRLAYGDHYMDDLRLTRPNSIGVGAAARFELGTPFGSQWAEIAVAEHDRPRRLSEAGRVGRLGRTRFGAVYEFTQDGGATRVELTTWSEPGSRGDALRESLGVRSWTRRKTKRALERLRKIFEEEQTEPLRRTTIAGYEPAKSPRYGSYVESPAP